MVNIDELIEDWNDIKSKISYYEHKLDKLKKIIDHELDRSENDNIKNSNYQISRRTMTRKCLTKNNVPEHIWEKYATESKPYYQYFTKTIKR